jgi:hypothetical protein
MTHTATDLTNERMTPRWVERIVTGRETSTRRVFWTTFVALALVSGIWALSNPLMASVDEPAHVVKAAATARGASDISPDGSAGGIGEVELPQLYEQLSLYPNCFAFQPGVTVSCQPSISGDEDAITTVSTSAINYNPLYYVVVGWPALLPDGEHTVYLMRIVNALVASALVAAAAAIVSTLPVRRWVGLALLLVLTPTLVNLMGSVNPQSFEVGGAILLWVSLLALLRFPDPRYQTGRLVAVVAATIPLANARSLGPMMVVIILGLCILSAPWRRTADLVRDRRSWWALGASIAACAASVLWTLTQDALPEGASQGNQLIDIVKGTLGYTSAYVQQMFVALGWLDVPAPLWVIFSFVACLGAVAIVAWAAGRTRDRLVIAAAAAIVFALPLASHILQADKIGFFWQGRYAFPIAFGVVLLAGFALGDRERVIPSWLTVNVVTTVALAFGVLQVVIFYGMLRRYATGENGGWILRSELPWLPLPGIVVAGLYTAAWAGLVVVVLRATTPRPSMLQEASEESQTTIV